MTKSPSSSRFLKGPLAPALLITLSLVVLATVWLRSNGSADAGPSASSDGIFIVHGLERVSSQTPQDWSQVADVVVLGEVSDENRTETPKSETATGDGTDIVGRTVTVDIEKVLWRAPSAKETSTGSIEMSASGWAANKGILTEAVSEGSSRLEIGHTYVMALAWKPAECSEGDETIPARWSTIGSGGVLPADESRLGHGEFQGVTVDLVDRKSIPADTVLSSLIGKTPADLGPLLDDVGPVERVDFMQGVKTC